MDQHIDMVAEYLAALKGSGTFGPQVVAHRTTAPTPADTVAPDLLHPEIRQLLAETGIQSLYSHQAAAIRLILEGSNVVVATPTASGKSLIYTLPVLQTLMDTPDARALWLFPLKALAQDQLKSAQRLWKLMPTAVGGGCLGAALYDGDTTAYQRKKIRELPPPILITNPDMLHLALLPYHHRWSHFFAGLRYVVIDEVHAYRGVFGSHVAWVLRRLARICALYGARPAFILASATIGNPGEHAAQLIDCPVVALTESGAGRGARHTLLLNPLDSAAVAASRLLEAAFQRGLRTIVYCRSRKMTELITIWTGQRLGERQNRLASYRAGFLPEERRGIEERLASGELLGVISTSALELGIDIGHLDLCILVGYPGSMMATWQRAGRVGRQKQSSLVVLIGHEDALDQHFMRHPEDFFSRPVEPVTINPDNPHIAGEQLICAAAESPLIADEPLLRGREMVKLLDRLTREGRLLQSAEGSTWYSPRTFPQRQVSLRGSGRTLVILTDPEKRRLGETDFHRALRECHPGAIYLHMARTYHIDSLDLETGEIIARAVNPKYFTRPLSEKKTEILAIHASRSSGAARVHYGTLRVTEHIIGYNKIAQGSMRIIGRVPLDLPPQVFETQGFWIEIPDWLRLRTEATRLHFMGAIHALEHAMIGLMPLFVLCDRNDLGGISHPWHDQVEGAAIFVYDGHAGGLGLCRKGYSTIDDLLALTRTTVGDCPCELGCPSCVHSPKCGSGNRPIDKTACLFVLDQLARGPQPPEQKQRPRPVPARTEAAGRIIQLPKLTGIFDLETQRSADEVGGWHRAHLMRVSVAVLYEHASGEFFTFTEAEIGAMIERLLALELVVGFNNKRFDNKVLSAYTRKDLALLPSLDILEVISSQLGYRLSLDRLAETTLKRSKEGNGLDALRWFRQGELERLAAYCRQDVELTKDLFFFGLRQQHLLFRNKAGRDVRLPVDFARAIAGVLERRVQTLRARQDPCGSSR